MDRETLIPYVAREQASVKHFLLESYLERLIMITAQKVYSHVAYVDAFAGPWMSGKPDLSDTSFARAIEVMEKCRSELETKFRRSVTFRALFIERNTTRFAQLKHFADKKSTSEIQITVANADFSDAAESVARWIKDDEMALVLVDPTGWKDVISPKTLAPLLRKRNVELLINFMWNFINLALGHANQKKNLRELFGNQLDQLLAENSLGSERDWMRAYLNQLKAAAGDADSNSRLRAAWFPVEFTLQDRVFYFLTYATHHVKGIIVFLEETDRALQYQKEVKFVVKQQRREAESGIADLFGDDLRPETASSNVGSTEVREFWITLLPTVGSEIRVDESQVAEMVEKCGCLISTVQSELRALISDGLLKNMDARGTRSKNVVNYREGERIARIR
jgi:three-Cys-motif partner protein